MIRWQLFLSVVGGKYVCDVALEELVSLCRSACLSNVHYAIELRAVAWL